MNLVNAILNRNLLREQHDSSLGGTVRARAGLQPDQTEHGRGVDDPATFMGWNSGFIDAPVAARSRAEISADDGAGTVGGESQSDSAAEPGGGASDHSRARREAVGKRRAHRNDWRS
ncbi:MAG: hypothetical protein Q9173_002604 [Seirophora scorigena]